MIRVYRVTRGAYAGDPFDGEGVFRYGGRWSSPGSRLVYTSEHQSLAMLEYLAHIDPANPPTDLVIAVAELPDAVKTIRFSVAQLEPDWTRYPAPAHLGSIGDEFVSLGQAAALLVPSVLAPTENNWLLNPKHPDFGRIQRRAINPFVFDPRLIR